MAEVKTPQKPNADWENVRDEWAHAVEQLVTKVEGWCKAHDWPTRRIEKQIDDPQIGEYVVPALLMQVDLTKLLLEPVTRFVHKWEGVIDLYRMPQYDDIASIFRRGNHWYYFSDITIDKLPESQRPADPFSDVAQMKHFFTEESFAELVGLMV
jgi:hypothetical protein